MTQSSCKSVGKEPELALVQTRTDQGLGPVYTREKDTDLKDPLILDTIWVQLHSN